MVLACEHIAERRPDIDPAVRSIKIDPDKTGGGSPHHWCESCAEAHAFTLANWSDPHWSETYGKASKKLIPVCSVCLEWLAG